MAAGPHAPSSQRIAEARASGHVPRAPLSWVTGLLALLVVVVPQRSAFQRELLALFREPLQAGDPARAWDSVRELALRCAWSLTLVFVLVAGATWLVQGPAFAAGTRKKFRKVRLDRTASALWAGAVALLAAFYAFAAVQLSVEQVGSFGFWLAFVSVACLAIDVAFARARWLSSLWMTRREFLDEQREQGPLPELVAARKRARS
ncbi:MAG TPA: hypothetical protein VI299_29600 [Polyangiales bacterium]